MIKLLEIKNFKSLAKCRIDGLARVNLIVGKNNVGKSSLLEALSLLLADGSPRYIQQLLRDRGISADMRPVAIRGRGEVIQRALASLYTGRDVAAFSREPIAIEAEIDEGGHKGVDLRLGFMIRNFPNHEVVDSEAAETTDVVIENGLEMYAGLFVNNSSGDKFYRISDRGLMTSFTDAASEFREFQFVRPSSVHSTDNDRLFDGIAMTGLQQNLIDALNIIDPRIRDVNFLNDPMALRGDRVPIVVLKDDDTRYPLRSMGDGVNRILTIVLSMLNCKGGALLVDEFENGLHYTALCDLWEMIFHLAEVLGVQVFATTHSSDCINSFIKADKRGEGALIRLETRNGGIIGVPYTDRDELNYIRDNNVEVR